MADDNKILKEIESASKEAESSLGKLQKQMETCHDFYNGKQWLESDYLKIQNNDGIPVVLNLIKKQVDALIGKRITTLTDLKANPIEIQDDMLSELSSRILKWVMDNCNANTYITQAHKDQIIGGLGWVFVDHDTSDDFISGDIKLYYERYCNVWVDPHCQNLLDLSDAAYVLRSKKVSKRELKVLFPKFSKEIDELKSPEGSSFFRFNRVSADQYKKIVVKEYWYKYYTKKTYLVNKEDSTDMAEWKGSSDQLHVELMSNPHLMAVDHTVPVIRVAISANDSLLLQDAETSLSRFPFIPFVGYYDASEDDWEQRVTGYANMLLDLQRQVNAHRSASLKVIMSMPLGSWVMDEGAVKDINDLRRMGGRTGVITKRAGRDLQRVDQQTLPASSVQMEQLFRQDMNIVGSSPEVIGNPSNLDSGKAISLMQSVGLMHTGEINEHLNFALRLLGIFILEIAYSSFTPGKIQRICGADFPIDPAILEAAKKGTRYDIKVDETTNSPTYQMAMWESIMGQVQHGIQVPYATLVEMNPFLPNEVKQKAMQQFQEQQAQAMAMQGQPLPQGGQQ